MAPSSLTLDQRLAPPVPDHRRDEILLAIRHILSLRPETHVGDVIEAICAHPDIIIQQETIHMLSKALGPLMPWREIADYVYSYESYPSPAFADYVSYEASCNPAPWARTLDETATEPPRFPETIADPVFTMFVHSSDKNGILPIAKAWGPCNPSPGFRGCLTETRMMCCERFMVPGQEDETAHWFTGHCQVCESKIYDMKSAIRRPISDGGWQGCFCGYRCLAHVVPSEELILINAMETIDGGYFCWSAIQLEKNRDLEEAMANALGEEMD